MEQLKQEQELDPVTSIAKRCVISNGKIVGRLKRVQAQLRVVDDILTKSGRPIVPVTLRNYVISRVHNTGPFGIEKNVLDVERAFILA